MNVDEYIKAFKNANVLVIGDIILDTYYKGIVNRISPEAPVPVLHVNQVNHVLGGAANVAQNIAELGANVGVIGVTGNDNNSNIICSLFYSNVNQHIIKLDGYSTINKIRGLSGGHQLIRIDFENELKLDSISSSIVEQFNQSFKNYDVVVISDYKKGVITEKTASFIITECNQNNIPVIVDPKGKNWDKYTGAYIIKPNISEMSEVTGISVKNVNDDVTNHGIQLRDKYSINHLIVTRSHLGVTYIGDSVKHIPTNAKEVFDVCGAGDTFVSVLAISIASKFGIEHAINLANKASGIVVGKVGTATVKLNELFPDRIAHKKLIDSVDSLKTMQSQGKKIIFTNGCFDILHVGHVAYLKEAKMLGDVLVVGVNSDDSIKRLKGPQRPVNSLRDRLLLLEALECVDYVITFDSDTPIDLIASIEPDVLVKGGDYINKEVVGSQFAKEVKLIDFINGYSSTNIINRINGE